MLRADATVRLWDSATGRLILFMHVASGPYGVGWMAYSPKRQAASQRRQVRDPAVVDSSHRSGCQRSGALRDQAAWRDLAEALLAVPVSGAGPSAAAPGPADGLS